MAKSGKILAPIMAVLAIAAAVLSFLVSNRRADFVNRAALLSSGVASIAQKLDIQSNSGVSSQVSFTPTAPGTKESGSLAWSSYKADQGAFQQTVDRTVSLAASLNSQRNLLAQTMVEMAIELRLPESELAADKLTNLTSYEKAAGQAKSHAMAVRERDDQLLATLRATAQTVGYNLASNEDAFLLRSRSFDEDGEEILGNFDCQNVLASYGNAVSLTKKRQDDFASALRASVDTINNYEWSADLSALSGTRYTGALGDLKNDYSGINSKLTLLKTTQEELRNVQAEKEKLEQLNAQLIAEAEETEKELAASRKKLTELGFAEGDLNMVAARIIQSFDELDTSLQGQVLLSNKDWNYVIVDLGSSALLKGVRLAISTQGKFLGTAEVTEVQERVALAEVIRGSINDIPVGAQVIISSQQRGAEDGGIFGND
jgi:molybdopterin converting factor small subunit